MPVVRANDRDTITWEVEDWDGFTDENTARELDRARAVEILAESARHLSEINPVSTKNAVDGILRKIEQLVDADD